MGGPGTSSSRTSPEDPPSEAPARTACYSMADFIAHALLKQEKEPVPRSRTWASTKPSQFSIRRSTGRRRDETPQGVVRR